MTITYKGYTIERDDDGLLYWKNGWRIEGEGFTHYSEVERDIDGYIKEEQANDPAYPPPDTPALEPFDYDRWPEPGRVRRHGAEAIGGRGYEEYK